MTAEKFGAVMGILVPQVVQLIVEQQGRSETGATADFYASGVYALLEQEDTKLWHLSPLTLFHLFEEEQRTGSFELPEEV